MHKGHFTLFHVPFLYDYVSWDMTSFRAIFFSSIVMLRLLYSGTELTLCSSHHYSGI